MARSGGAVVHKWHGVALSLRARRTGQGRRKLRCNLEMRPSSNVVSFDSRGRASALWYRVHRQPCERRWMEFPVGCCRKLKGMSWQKRRRRLDATGRTVDGAEDNGMLTIRPVFAGGT
jgi:hypothetical protein